MSETRVAYDYSSHPMTWDQFKALVDARLKELGKDGSIHISLIDVSFSHVSGQKSDELDISIDVEYADGLAVVIE